MSHGTCQTVSILVESTDQNPSGIVVINQSDHNPATMKLVHEEDFLLHPSRMQQEPVAPTGQISAIATEQVPALVTEQVPALTTEPPKVVAPWATGTK